MTTEFEDYEFYLHEKGFVTERILHSMTMSTATGKDRRGTRDEGQDDKKEDDHEFVTLFAI